MDSSVSRFNVLLIVERRSHNQTVAMNDSFSNAGGGKQILYALYCHFFPLTFPQETGCQGLPKK